MFKFLKEKLKNVFGKIKEDIEEKTEEQSEELKKDEIKLEEADKKEIEKLEEKKQKVEDDKEKKERILEELKEISVDKSEIKEEIKAIVEEVKEIEKEEKEIEKTGEKEKKGFFQKIKEKFTTTKLSEDDFNELFEQLEMTLLENNIAVSVIGEIKKKLKDEFVDRAIGKKEIEEKIKSVLRETLSKILIDPFDLIKKVNDKKEKPFVIVFFGINGAGKTTTIAKVANLLQKNKFKCVLAASDTFRAASIEQLEKHAANLGINIIKHQYGADPAAVAFDAISHAKAAGKEVVLIDTAGRMHTKADLMREMEKIVRVAKPDLKIFIGESITGNDAVEQASAFNKSIGIDAVILTKADVDEKGGAMISVSNVTGKPILFLGTGQEYKDLEYFDKNKIISSILD
jgi:fused signal recognition particle receptor